MSVETYFVIYRHCWIHFGGKNASHDSAIHCNIAVTIRYNYFGVAKSFNFP